MVEKWWNRILMYDYYGEPLPKYLCGRGFLLLIGLVLLGLNSADGSDMWTNSVSGSWTLTSGNTEQSEYAATGSFSRKGDIKIGSTLLQDTELRIVLSHSRGVLEDSLYQHEGEATFLFDVMAHQTFSPFFLSGWEYDSTAGLDSRLEAGLGLKWAFGSGFSISGAVLFELEDYKGEGRVSQIRWSIRPKYKKTFPSGMSVVYMVFFKPIQGDFNNYLIKNDAFIELPTALPWLSIKLTVEHDYNSQPPSDVKKWDNEINIGIKINL